MPVVALAALFVCATALRTEAASQTWTNAPVDSSWTNINNWVGRAVPGGLNQTGNTVNNDTATFNTPIPASNIGSALNPILTDDATATNNARCRQIGSIIFDTADCGAYTFSTLSPVQTSDPNSPFTGVLYISHNGSIRINDAVTNSQTFLVPLRTRLPSSTAGVYNFVNNSTNAGVTLFISSVTNDSANTRGTVFTLGGTSTGTNTIAALSAGTTTTGANGLTKQGPGTWILSGPNDFRSQTVVSILDGTLIVKDPSAFSLASTATITNTGVLQIDGVNLVQPVLTLRKGGTIRMNGTEAVNGVAVGNQAATAVTLSTTSASDVFTVGTGLTGTSVVSGGAADSVLHTAGPGTILLQTINSYVGNWSFEAVNNQLLNFSLSGSRNVHISAGATLDVSPLGGFYTLGSLSFSASGTGTTVGSTAATINAGAGGSFDFGSKDITLNFAPTSFAGDTTHPALYISQGSISLSGNFFTINNTSGTPLGVGTYRLIQQASGNVSVFGGPFAVVLGSGLAAGTIGDIQVSGGNVNLVVSTHASANLSWQGGNPDNTWDSLNTANWSDGSGFVQFGSGDAVTFGALGSSFPTVNISGTVLPSSVKVDTSSGDYTFSGSGQIAGPAGLTKTGSGNLTLQTVNAYLGGTTISNGTVHVGVENAIPSAGSGNVTIVAPGTIDLNGFNNVVNGLNGNGAIDNQSLTPSVLTVGNNNASGSFSGPIQSTVGALGLTKLGSGTVTLSASNSYSGGTILNAGTLAVVNPYALGTNDVAVNAGTLNVQTDLHIASLSGGGGVIANNSTANTNRIVIEGNAQTTAGASITDGSGGGGMALTLLGGSLTLSGNNTFTGGTIVGSGATLAIPNGPAALGGSVIASNASELFLSGGSSTPGTPSSVTTVDGATVTFNSGAEGKIWNAQFNGSANTTNIFVAPISAGQPLSFSNFLGTVIFNNTNANANFRFFNGGGISGGENTLFVFERVNVHTRDSQTVRLGAITGGNTLAGIGDQAGTVSWEIGAKNLSTTFEGYIMGVNNSLVKVGTGSLTLDGRSYFTNTVTLPDASVVDYPLFTNAISYLGSTTISNGTLKVVAPNNLTNSPTITLAGGVLDATQIGYASNETTLDISAIEQPTNTVVVMTGNLDILSGQRLSGQGSILGNVIMNDQSTLDGGSGVGTLSVSGSLVLPHTVNLNLDRSNPAQNSSRITAASFSGSGATLNITNIGPVMFGNTTFQLFGSAVTAFTTVNLPTTDPSGQVTYTWQNDLAVDGSIKLLSGVNPDPTSLDVVVNGGNLDLSWPADHTGWLLQTQTNTLTTGLSTNWFDVPNSTLTNQVSAPISATNPAVFFRLVLPAQ